MQTIKYRFADGTTSEIEVTDEFYTLYAKLVQQEKRNHWKETRRHTSLDYLNENGIDFESPAADPLSVLLRSEDEERIHKALSALSDKQRVVGQAKAACASGVLRGQEPAGNRAASGHISSGTIKATCHHLQKNKKIFLKKVATPPFSCL